MYLKKTKRVYSHAVLKEIKEHKGIENPTVNQVLSHLFGDEDGWVASDYTVRAYEKVKTNPIQRLNTIWVYPLYALIVAPVKWIVTGDTGVKTESRFYGVLKFLLGDPK